MIKKLVGTISKNQTAQALLMAAPASMAMYLVRDIPGKLWNLGKTNYSLVLKVMSDNDDYDGVTQLAEKHIFRSREYTAKKKLVMEPGYGDHYGKYNGVYFHYKRENAQGNASSEWFRETTTITFFTRKRRVLQEFLKEAHKERKKNDLGIHTNESYGWTLLGPLAPRQWDSIIFDKKEDILEHIRKFEESEQAYLAKGLPYHTGVLLYGQPGTGKTSLIHALANKLQRSVYYLNPSQVRKESLIGLLSLSDWSNKLLVIEDIDVSGAPTDRKEHEGFQLSELLNTLDGIVTPHGMVTIATTNSLASLDAALLRPGRFDYILEVGKLSEDEMKQLAERFDKQPISDYTPMTGAEIRNYFLRN